MNLEGIRKRNLELLHSEKLSDCRFLVGLEPSDQKTFAAHKLILATASPVFEAMFYGDLAEKSDPIPIPDIQPNIFDDMLKFIYCDFIDISSSDMALQLCYAGKKYLLADIVKKCCDYIYSTLSWENACEAYEFAVLYDEKDLKHKSMGIIKSYTQTIVQYQNFFNIQMSTLLDILDQDYLAINSEYDVYNILLNFFKKKYNKTKIHTTPNNLIHPHCSDNNGEIKNDIKIADQDDFEHLDVFEKAFKKIRYLTMTPKEFAEGPANCRFIKMHEAFEIFLIISSPSNAHYPVPEGFCGCRINRNRNRRIEGITYVTCKIHNNKEIL